MRIERACVSFGDVPVLAGVSLTLSCETSLALTGPSGSGKSTLINLALGFLRPSEGFVERTDERIGTVFQEDRLIEWMGAAENVLWAIGKRSPVGEVRALIAALGLEAAGEKPVSTFSGGMRRRVAIARALAYQPDLLLLDEPFRGLDDAARKVAADAICQHSKGRGIVLVTHDRIEARLLGLKQWMRIENGHLACAPSPP